MAAGADLEVVQAMLRRSSIAITADTYTTVLPEVARHTAEAAAGNGASGTSVNSRAPVGLP